MRPNTPLQQTKPRDIMWAFNHRVRGFAAERQDVMPRPQHRETGDEVMAGVASELRAPGLFLRV